METKCLPNSHIVVNGDVALGTKHWAVSLYYLICKKLHCMKPLLKCRLAFLKGLWSLQHVY